MTDQYTLLFSPDHKQRKVFSIGGDGEIQKTKIHFPRYFRHKIGHVDSLRDLYTKITTEIAKPYAPSIALMRGAFVGGEALESAEKRRIEAVEQIEARGGIVSESLEYPFYKREDGKLFTRRLNHLVQDQPRHWVVFDLDDFRPEGVSEARFDVGNPKEWVDAAISQELGDDFVAVDYILQLSSSAGLPKKKNISAHVWFWMAQGMDSAAWKAWLASRTAVLGRKPKVDAGLFQPARVIYIAPPKFIKGAVDPVEAVNGSRWTYVEGDFGSEVHLSEGVVDWEAVDNARFAAEMRGNALVVGDDADSAREAWERPGVVGAWNRAFSMSETIRRFLAQEYRVDDEHGRVTWLRSPSGAVGSCKIVSGNTRMFSTSAGDPMEGYVGSAFDHIEKILFDGDYAACCDWALKIPEVRLELEREASLVFDDGLVGGSDGLGVKPIEIGEIEVSEGVAEPAPARVVTAETIAAEYPMPDNVFGTDQEYRFIHGAWWFGFNEADEDEDDSGGKKGKGKKKKRKGSFVRLWSPISVIGYMCDNSTEDLTVEIKIMGPDGSPQILSWPRGHLSRRKEIETQLLNRGWRARPREMALFLDHLQEDSASPTRTVGRGWEVVPGGRVFSTPIGEVFGAPEGMKVRVRPGLAMRPEVVTRGSLEGWRDALDKHLEGEMKSVWAIGVAAGFCGPIVQVADFSTPAVWVYGASRSGKTLALRLAVSAWSTPFTDGDDKKRFRDQEALFRTMNMTSNSLEIISTFANGTVLALDESGSKSEKDKKELASFIYNLVSGKGKERMTQDASALRTSFTWEAFAICTAEHSPDHIVREAKGAPLPQGTMSRMAPIFVPALKDEDANTERGRALYSALEEHHGHAGTAFVKALIERGYGKAELRVRQDAVRAELMGLLTKKTAVLGTAVGTFALLRLGGDLAFEFGLIGAHTHAAIVAGVAERWLAFASGEAGKTLGEDAVERIDGWIAAQWSNFVKRGEEARVGYAGAQGWAEKVEGESGQWIVYLSAEKLVEAADGAHEARRLAGMLDAQGRIARKDSGRFASKVYWATGRPRGYAIYVEGPEGEIGGAADLF